MSSDKLTDDQKFRLGWHGVPLPAERAVMSAEDLAISLSKQEKGSPPYILLEHELNLRLAKEQANATKEAGRYGGHAAILGALLTALVGYWLGSSQAQESSKANACPSTTCTCACPIAPPNPSVAVRQAPNSANGKVNPKP